MSDRHDLLRMESLALKLASAAQDVNKNIMNSGLAWRRERLEYRILEVEAKVEENRAKRAAGGPAKDTT